MGGRGELEGKAEGEGGLRNCKVKLRWVAALRTSQSYTLCTDLPKLRNHPNIEKNTSIVNVIDKYIHKLDIYYKKKKI